MIKEQIEKLNNAFNKYNLDLRDEITDKILNYIIDRIKANKKEIEELIKLKKSNIKYEQILDVIKNESKVTEEDYGKTIINKKEFMFSQALVPIGLIAIETYETLEIIKYYIRAIKTKNAVAISSINYDEQSVEALVLIIIQEALKKYKLDENLIMYLPYEECFYEYFDKILYTYDKEEKALEKVVSEDKQIDDDTINKKYVYLEDEEFRIEAEKNEDVEFITGNIDEVLNKIKYAKCATIYTKKSDVAYKFINLANCENVFVNTNVINVFGTPKSTNEFYKYKNIIVPIPKEFIKNINEKEEISKIGSNTLHKKEEKFDLIEYKESIWKRILKIIKKLLK